MMTIILLCLLIKPVKVYIFELAVEGSTRRARRENLEGHWRTDSTGMLASSSICQRTCSDALERKPTQRCDQRNDREETAYLVHDTPLCLLFKQKMLVSFAPAIAGDMLAIEWAHLITEEV